MSFVSKAFSTILLRYSLFPQLAIDSFFLFASRCEKHFNEVEVFEDEPINGLARNIFCDLRYGAVYNL